MALLNPADHARRFARPIEARLNWRLMLSLGATLAFWVAAGTAVARLV